MTGPLGRPAGPGPLGSPGRPVTCPCGSGASYDACCGPLLAGARLAATPLELMRSRYTAFAVGGREGLDHLFRTWHPRTRPPRLVEDGLDTDRTWTRLEVLGQGADWVEFDAHYARLDGTAGVQHEHSLFAQRAGRWVYVEAAPDTP